MALDAQGCSIVYAVSPVGQDGSAAELREALSAGSFDCHVLIAQSAEEALSQLQRPETSALVVDVSIEDMPVIDLLERARRLRPRVARMLSAPGLAADLAEAVNRGRISGYLSRPFRPDALRAVLGSSCDSGPWDGPGHGIAHGIAHGMEMSLWYGGQEAAASTIYEELVHELSNPLGALEINASLVTDLLQEVVQADATDSEQVHSAAHTALEAHADSLAAIEQMKSLVSRMRHGRRSRPRKQGRCDAKAVIDATARMVRAEVEKVARLQVSVDAGPIVSIDGSVLGQVLLNLVLNAAQAVPADHIGQNLIEVGALARGDRFLIRVRDNGPGIAPELQERVFEPFFTTKENGSGLGLAICRELVTRAHGAITVQNLATGGAEVEVALPVAK